MKTRLTDHMQTIQKKMKTIDKPHTNNQQTLETQLTDHMQAINKQRKTIDKPHKNNLQTLETQSS